MVSEPNPGQSEGSHLRSHTEGGEGASLPNEPDATADYPFLKSSDPNESGVAGVPPLSPEGGEFGATVPGSGKTSIVHQSHGRGPYHFSRLPEQTARESVVSQDASGGDNPGDNLSEPATETFSESRPIESKGTSLRDGVRRGAKSLETGPPSGISLPPGTMLGHFVVSKFIGGGGMGRVYLGIDQSLDRKVAIKVLQRQRAQDQFSVARFMNEARSAARLNHEHIAQVYYAGQQDDVPFIAFEYVEGTNIRSIIENQGVFSIPQAMTYLIQIAHALDHAAFHGVVHRDVKPSNILITKEERAKLIDMGLARLLKPTDPGDDLTASGVTLGTFDYISPEQARDPRNADIRSDIYSLGCTFFFMLAGRPPFHEGTVLQKLLQHQGDEPPDIRHFVPGTPDEIALLMQRMMAKDPRQRFQTPAALLAELTEVARLIGLRPSGPGNTVWTMRSGMRPSRLLAHLPWMTALVLFFVASFTLPFYWGGEGDNPPVVVPPDSHAGFETSGVSSSNDPGNSTSDSTRRSVWSRISPKVWSSDSGEAAEDAGIVRLRWNEGHPPVFGVKTNYSPENMFAQQMVPVAGSGNPSVREHSDGAHSGGGFTAETSTVSRRFSAGIGIPFIGANAVSDVSDVSHSLFADVFSRAPGDLSNVSATSANATPVVLVVDPAVTRNEDGVFSTLAAAVAVAGKNATIELRFNGTGKEAEKIELVSLAEKQLTIQAGKGFSPSISFRPSGYPDVRTGRSGRIAFFLLNASDVKFRNIAFEMDVSSNVIAEKWALFELFGFSRVQFEHCTFTVRHPNAETSGFHGVSLFRSLTLSRSESGRIASSNAGHPPGSPLVEREILAKDRTAALLPPPPEGFPAFFGYGASDYLYGNGAVENTTTRNTAEESPERSTVRRASFSGEQKGGLESAAVAARSNHIVLNNCIVRGETGFLDVESNRSTGIVLNNVFVAISLPFLNLRGVRAEAEENSEVVVSFKHLSYYGRGGLCRYTKSDDALPLAVLWMGKYSAFRLNHTSIAEFQGFHDQDEAGAYFKWTGEKNFFQEVRDFAIIESGGSDGVAPISLSEWKKRGAVTDSVDVDVFLPTELEHKRTSRMLPGDLTLSTRQNNPARQVAPPIAEGGSVAIQENAGLIDRLLPEIRATRE